MSLFKKIFHKKEEPKIIELNESKLSEWLNEIEVIDVEHVKKLCHSIEDQIREVRSRVYDLERAKRKEKVDKRLLKRIEQSRSLLIQTIKNSINRVGSLESFEYDNIVRYHASLLQTMLAMTEPSEKHSFLIIQLYKDEMQKLNKEIVKMGHSIDELGKLLTEKEETARSIKEVETLLNDLNSAMTKITNTNSEINESKKDISKLKEEIRERIIEEKDLNDSKEIKIAFERRVAIESLEKELEDLKSEVLNYFSTTKKPLKKYEYLVEKGLLSVPKGNITFLSNFQKYPLETLLKDENNLTTLKKILAEIVVLMKKGQIPIKDDKRREKTITQIEKMIDGDYISIKLREHHQLETKIKEKMDEDSFKVLKKLDELKSKIHMLESRLNREKEKLKELEEIKIEQEKLKGETKKILESIVSEVTNKEIRIRYD